MVRKLKPTGHSSNNSQADIIKKAQEMQKQMLVIQEGLKDKFVDASVAGGQVTAKANGQKEIVELKIGKEIIEEAAKEDSSELEQLVLSVINEVLEKAEKLAESEMEVVTGGVNIPGLF